MLVFTYFVIGLTMGNGEYLQTLPRQWENFSFSPIITCPVIFVCLFDLGEFPSGHAFDMLFVLVRSAKHSVRYFRPTRRPDTHSWVRNELAPKPCEMLAGECQVKNPSATALPVSVRGFACNQAVQKLLFKHYFLYVWRPFDFEIRDTFSTFSAQSLVSQSSTMG